MEDTENVVSEAQQPDEGPTQRFSGAGGAWVLGWDQCRSTRSGQWRSIDTRIGKRADGLAGPSIVDDDR